MSNKTYHENIQETQDEQEAAEPTWQDCVRCGFKVHINHVDYENDDFSRPFHHDHIQNVDGTPMCRDSESKLRRRQEVTLELNGLGEFKALVHDVNIMAQKTARELQSIFKTNLTEPGRQQAILLPRWQRNIVAAGILHALN
jgi:hypothetical protein